MGYSGKVIKALRRVVAKNKLPFFHVCVGWPRHYEDVLDYICEKGDEIERDEFLEHIDWESFAPESPDLKMPKLYPKAHSKSTPDDLIPADDWAIRYYKLNGFPIYWFVHSGIEHVFAIEDTIKAIQQKVQD